MKTLLLLVLLAPICAPALAEKPKEKEKPKKETKEKPRKKEKPKLNFSLDEEDLKAIREAQARGGS